MRFPTDEQIETAILWLENNEGDEAPDCFRVATWLRNELTERIIRNGARRAGVTVARFRKKLGKVGRDADGTY